LIETATCLKLFGMGMYDWETLYLEERVQERRREMYLDMRNAHIIAKKKILNINIVNRGKEYIKIYNKTLVGLREDYVNREQGEIRRRNVWESKRTV
jgi:hypothetical protein